MEGSVQKVYITYMAPESYGLPSVSISPYNLSILEGSETFPVLSSPQQAPLAKEINKDALLEHIQKDTDTWQDARMDEVLTYLRHNKKLEPHILPEVVDIVDQRLGL